MTGLSRDVLETPGVKTSKFVLGAGSAGAIVALALHDDNPTVQIAIISIAMVSIVYAICRSRETIGAVEAQRDKK